MTGGSLDLLPGQLCLRKVVPARQLERLLGRFLAATTTANAFSAAFETGDLPSGSSEPNTSSVET